MEQYIGVVITLFLLSMISERVANFFKNFLSEANTTGVGALLRKLFKVSNLLKNDFNGSLTEERRAYRILKINLLSSFFIAFVLNADLLYILKNYETPFDSLANRNLIWIFKGEFWTSQNLKTWPKYLVGCLATGCFISFGSKFWHDMLDLLYQIKNIKRIQADPGTYAIDNIKSFDNLVNTYQSDFIKLAFFEARTAFMAEENVKAISLCSDSQGFYFKLTLKQADTKLSDRYQYFLADGTPQNIRIKINVLGPEQIKFHRFDLSAKLFDSSKPTAFGTIGFIVKPNRGDLQRRYILTCCHNLIDPISNLPNVAISSIKPETLDQGHIVELGTVEKVIIDDEVDVALIRIEKPVQDLILNTMPKMGSPNGPRVLKTSDEGKVDVYMHGASTPDSTGVVTSVYSDIKITEGGGEFKMINLITVSRDNKAISKSGDSGSVVFDEKNNVLGMLVAGSYSESYIIPINVLLSKLDVQLTELI